MQYIRPTSQVILEVVSIVAQDQREEREARLELETRYNAFVEALRVEQETILSYFDRVFGERDNALRQFYGVLDRASLNGDNERLKTAVEGIIGIIRSNPLMGFEDFQRALVDSRRTIEL